MLDLVVILGIAAALIFVVRCGDGPERAGGLVMLLILAFSVLRLLITTGPVDDFDLLGLLSDGFAFIGFSWIALFAWRFWPIWTAALQLLAIGAHFGPALQLPVDPLAYAIMRTAPTAVAILSLVAATIFHLRKPGLVGSKQRWRTWSGPLSRISPKRWPRAFLPNTGR